MGNKIEQIAFYLSSSCYLILQNSCTELLPRLGGGGRGVGGLSYMGSIGMYVPKEYGLSVVLFMNRALILAHFGHFGFFTYPCYGYVFKKKPLSHHYRQANQQKPFTNYVYGNLTLV